VTAANDPDQDRGSAAGLVRLLRWGLLGLAGLSVLAIAFELAAERHWNNAVQLIPWVVLVVLVTAIGLASSSRPKLILAARVLSGLALAASAFGIWEHVADNYQVGEMDAVYSDSWVYRSMADRIYLAFTKTVGAAPPIAPGALGQAGLLVLLATVGKGKRVKK
jgi:hypothetical protein